MLYFIITLSKAIYVVEVEVIEFGIVLAVWNSWNGQRGGGKEGIPLRRFEILCYLINESSISLTGTLKYLPQNHRKRPEYNTAC